VVLSWKQQLPHVEHSDLQGTYNEEIHVFEIRIWCVRQEVMTITVNKKENCLLCYASSGGFLTDFSGQLLVPFSGFKNPKN